MHAQKTRPGLSKNYVLPQNRWQYLEQELKPASEGKVVGNLSGIVGSIVF
jgi:hypothetical protein